MLALRPNCECCDRDLPPQTRDAMMCSFECTFCKVCAERGLKGRSPNCGGELDVVHWFRGPIESFALEHPIHLGRVRNRNVFRASPRFHEGLRIAPSAFEARTMTGGQSGRLIEEEEIGVAGVPNLVAPIFE